MVTFHKWLDNEGSRSSYQCLVTWDFVRYLPHYFLTKSSKANSVCNSCFSMLVRKKEIQILKDFFDMSCHLNLHWFFMNWHIKCFALLPQFCCIFILKLLLVECHTFTLIVNPLQCFLDIWLSWAICSSIQVLNFLRVLCFQTFHLHLCYISQANLT